MDNTREKLIELLSQVQYQGNAVHGYHDKYVLNSELADHLIAKGVTVQEWISVKDRLPENDSDVLAYLRIGEEGRIYPANYAKGMWFDCIFNTPATESTTHWMPLPQPPKGE